MHWIQDPDSSDILSEIEYYLLTRKGLSKSISHDESSWEIEKQIWETCEPMSIGEKKLQLDHIYIRLGQQEMLSIKLNS